MDAKDRSALWVSLPKSKDDHASWWTRGSGRPEPIQDPRHTQRGQRLYGGSTAIDPSCRLPLVVWPDGIAIAMLRLGLTTWSHVMQVGDEVIMRKDIGIGMYGLAFVREQLAAYGLTQLEPAFQRVDFEILDLPDRPVAPRSGPCVYFIGCHEYIKIGQSTDLRRRFSNLQNANPFALKLLGIQPQPTEQESYGLEYTLHNGFMGSHRNAEWYWDDEDIRAYIEKLPDCFASRLAAVEAAA